MAIRMPLFLQKGKHFSLDHTPFISSFSQRSDDSVLMIDLIDGLRVLSCGALCCLSEELLCACFTFGMPVSLFVFFDLICCASSCAVNSISLTSMHYSSSISLGEAMKDASFPRNCITQRRMLLLRSQLLFLRGVPFAVGLCCSVYSCWNSGYSNIKVSLVRPVLVLAPCLVDRWSLFFVLFHSAAHIASEK